MFFCWFAFAQRPPKAWSKATASLRAGRTLKISQGSNIYFNQKKKHRHVECTLEFKAMIQRTYGSDIVCTRCKFLCYLLKLKYLWVLLCLLYYVLNVRFLNLQDRALLLISEAKYHLTRAGAWDFQVFGFALVPKCFWSFRLPMINYLCLWGCCYKKYSGRF